MLKKKFIFALTLLLLLAPMSMALASGGDDRDDRFDFRVRNDNDFEHGALFNKVHGLNSGLMTPNEKFLLHKIMLRDKLGLGVNQNLIDRLSTLNNRLVGLGHANGVGTFGMGLDGKFDTRFNGANPFVFGNDRDIRVRVEDDRVRIENKADDNDDFDNDRDFRFEVRNDRNNDFDFDGDNSGRG